jgi:hypothetical protein
MWADTYEWDWEYIGNTGGDDIKKWVYFFCK